MNSEESDTADLKDESSTSEEDKKFVSQGVAFVIGHTRNGFVALCASVATLLKEQAKLKLENEALKQEIALLKSEHIVVPPDKNVSCKCKESFTSCSTKDTNSERPVLLEKGIQYSDSLNHKKFKRKLARAFNACKQDVEVKDKMEATFNVLTRLFEFLTINRTKSSQMTATYATYGKDFKKKSYRALKGCLCDRCNEVSGNAYALSAPLQIGDKVVISGEICGTVQYVGHVDSVAFPEIFIGLHLDEAVGDSTGTMGNKTYFTVPPGYGLFAPLLNVCCKMS